jgi:hypothetical protein
MPIHATLRQDWYRLDDLVLLPNGTALVALCALGALLGTDEEKVENFLDEIGCPVIHCPNGKAYFSAWTLELALTHKMTGLSWKDSADLLARGKSTFQSQSRKRAFARLALTLSRLLWPHLPTSRKFSRRLTSLIESQPQLNRT